MKVLISAPSLDAQRNVSGVSSVVRNIMAALSPGVEFDHIHLGSPAAGNKPASTMTQIWSALLRVSRSRYDVFHSNTALNIKSIMRDFCVIMAAVLSGHRVVLHIHGGTYLFERPNAFLRLLVKAMAKVCTHIVVLSEMEVDAFHAIYGGFPIEVIYNGSIPTTDQHTTAGPNVCRFLFMGRFVPEKGLEVLIEAIERIVPDSDISFCFYGNGPMLDVLTNLAAGRSDVLVMPPFGSPALPTILAQSDVLLLPSLNGEGMPMAVIEAMHAGVVPLCTKIASIPEIVVHDNTGILIEPNSVEQLVAAIERLSSSRSTRESLSDAAAAFARKRLVSTTNYLKLISLYAA